MGAHHSLSENSVAVGQKFLAYKPQAQDLALSKGEPERTILRPIRSCQALFIPTYIANKGSHIPIKEPSGKYTLPEATAAPQYFTSTDMQQQGCCQLKSELRGTQMDTAHALGHEFQRFSISWY